MLLVSYKDFRHIGISSLAHSDFKWIGTRKKQRKLFGNLESTELSTQSYLRAYISIEITFWHCSLQSNLIYIKHKTVHIVTPQVATHTIAPEQTAVYAVTFWGFTTLIVAKIIASVRVSS